MSITAETAAALRATSYQLRDDAMRAENNARRLHEEAAAHEARALGLRSAASYIDMALDEDGAP